MPSHRYRKRVTGPNGFRAEIEHRDPFTVAHADQLVRLPGRAPVRLHGTGFSKRAKSDQPNPNVGEKLALARAEDEIRAKWESLKEEIHE